MGSIGMEPESGSVRMEFVRPLLIYRWRLLALAILVGLVTMAVRLSSKPDFTATVVLVPTTQGSDVSDRVQQFSGLASLAGINLRQDRGVSSFDRFFYLVFSPDLAAYQIEHRPILQTLFPQRWDAEHKTWVPPHGISATIKNVLSSVTGAPAWQPPDLWSVADEYKLRLSIRKVAAAGDARETQMVQLSYVDSDPQRAQAILLAIVTDANQMLRDFAQARASVQAKYLRTQLSDVAVQDYRATLEKLLSEQEQTLMLTASKLPFAAEPVSAQIVPALQSPRRSALYAAIFGAIAFSIGFLFAILAFNWRREQYAEHYFDNKAAPILPGLGSLFGLRRASGRTP
jgi:uncharacterized protein involved in exopolysaccharide biosynthesis